MRFSSSLAQFGRVLMLLCAVLGGVTVVCALPVFPGARGYGTETAAGRGMIGVPGSLTVYVGNSLVAGNPSV